MVRYSYQPIDKGSITDHEEMIQMATITPTELAAKLDTDPRTTRKFLRSITPKEDQPGKGSRWAIEKRDVRSLQAKFKKFEAAEAAAKAERLAAKEAAEAAQEAEEEVTLDEGPTDAELAEIDAEG